MFIIAILAVTTVYFGLKYLNKLTPAKYFNQRFEKKILISRGDNLLKIAEKLKTEKLIVSEYYFIFYAKYKKMNTRIKAGEYLIPNNLTNRELIKILIKGCNIFYKITIPEGLTNREIASMFAEKLDKRMNFKEDIFLELCQNSGMIKKYTDIDALTSEGMMFPETYSYNIDDNETSFFKMMLYNFEKKTGPLKKLSMPLSMSFYDVLKLAAIVEKEAVFSDEMPAIAGVYINRIKQGMNLEADPTVIYALGYKKSRLLYDDLKIDSPYNTYKYSGLTPTPICNPGYNAVYYTIYFELNNYIFFVAEPGGRHLFSTTNSQHNRNRAYVKKLIKNR